MTKAWFHEDRMPEVEPRLTKDEAPCCVSKRDAHGRMPVGYCSPDCLRRPK